MNPVRASVVRALADGVGPRELAQTRRRLGSRASPVAIASALTELSPAERDGRARPPPAAPERLLVHGDAGFPSLLAQAWSMGGPLWVHVTGDVGALDGAATVGIVGSRRPTVVGSGIAREMAFTLAGAGIVVVSGLARGIDQAAHRGALEAGGRTVAVLGTGLGVAYPNGSAALKEAIVRRGALVTEHPRGWGVRHPSQFLTRNRILAGLCHVLVVVDAGARSGALSTAGWAGDMARTVAAVPASPATTAAAGSLALLRDGAVCVRHAADVIELLDPEVRPTHRVDVPTPRPGGAGSPPMLPPGQQRLLDVLGGPPIPISVIAAHLRRPAPSVLTDVAKLQAQGLVRQTPDGVVLGGRRG